MAIRCEDYPCCGHTDGLGCNYDSSEVYNDPHLYCDHNTGVCEIDPDPNDEWEDEDEDFYEGGEDAWLDGYYEE